MNLLMVDPVPSRAGYDYYNTLKILIMECYRLDLIRG